MDLSVEVTGDTVTVRVSDVHPIDYDSAARTVRELAVELHRAVVNDEAA